MKSYLKLALLAVIIIGIGTTAAFTLTSKPSFCKTCHEMRNDYRAWASSEHASVPCLSCHAEPGTVNLLKHKLDSLSEVFKHIKGSYQLPINDESNLSAGLPAANCLNCHGMSGKGSSERLTFNHEKHQSTGLACAYCHNRVGHPDLKQYEERITKPLCMDCHRERGVTTECNVCHPSGFKLKPASHEERNWVKLHDERVTKDCLYCHGDETRSCDACHGLPMPHPQGWQTSHPQGATKLGQCGKCHRDKNYCERCHHQGYEPTREVWREVHPRVAKAKAEPGCRGCHATSFCDTCHRTVNSHPSEWLSSHAPAVRKTGSTKCARCHNTRFCTNCHVSKNPHAANWASIHKSQDISRCSTCHSTASCDNCHRTINPHAAGWLSNHSSIVRAEGESKCLKCHAKTFCTYCHTTRNPHPANWQKAHEKSATSGCPTCHATIYCESCHSRRKKNGDDD